MAGFPPTTDFTNRLPSTTIAISFNVLVLCLSFPNKNLHNDRSDGVIDFFDGVVVFSDKYFFLRKGKNFAGIS